MSYLIMAVVFLPLLGGCIAGLWGHILGRRASHWITTSFTSFSFFISCYLLYYNITQNLESYNFALYHWGNAGNIQINIGFLIDRLTLLMMTVVSFVSWMVHIYSIGYMHDDPGYQRFFSYISLFTFGMLMLVMSNNFLQLYFGWEMVGLMSYLLIGFWYNRESANRASLKAFIVNRVGDFGFLIGIAAVMYYFGSLDYETVFRQAPNIAKLEINLPHALGSEISALTFICLFLFIGAMGKSAQMPLHVWLPDSMEGPTPISALIHAATMVTAGVFMIARMSPLFEFSNTALEVVMGIGALTALLTGLLGLVQSDIKRIIAYSTLSQLGYMMTAMGASAYPVGIFHLMTHAFFKALLFLGAGSVIIAMHHEQNIWRMGGLRRYMPITYWTMLLATLALVGFPGFSGFYSKDLIIEAVQLANIKGSTIVYWIVLGSVFITSLYSFRLLFVVFHGGERFNKGERDHLHESPAVITVPLVVLAIPSLVAGALFIGPLFSGYFGNSMVVHPEHTAMQTLTTEFHGALPMFVHGLYSIPFILVLLGIFTAWYCYIRSPEVPAVFKRQFHNVYHLLRDKYGFDRFYEWITNRVIKGFAWLCWRLGDEWLIDGVAVNGTAHSIQHLSKKIRHLQTGYLYNYAFAMIVGFLILVGWLLIEIKL